MRADSEKFKHPAPAHTRVEIPSIGPPRKLKAVDPPLQNPFTAYAIALRNDVNPGSAPLVTSENYDQASGALGEIQKQLNQAILSGKDTSRLIDFQNSVSEALVSYR